eukprot:NODE_1722_length_1321_cov_4.153302_g1434_i0.p1 GENE.NODE_1722_length_1321_cov_4.153302_g1434_i0~~NODE_1722_length_1321_cov_4.153302_g1434_i0.p1  ORF type:complete len:194 (-),score=8.27 NODE_1722_length_1321_cov_4.153302_g1434_i0:142-723(-)
MRAMFREDEGLLQPKASTVKLSPTSHTCCSQPTPIVMKFLIIPAAHARKESSWLCEVFCCTRRAILLRQRGRLDSCLGRGLMSHPGPVFQTEALLLVWAAFLLLLSPDTNYPTVSCPCCVGVSDFGQISARRDHWPSSLLAGHFSLTFLLGAVVPFIFMIDFVLGRSPAPPLDSVDAKTTLLDLCRAMPSIAC